MDFVNSLNRNQLVMMVYNLRRLMSIFNLNELKTRLRSFIFNVLTKYKPKRAVLRHFNFLFEKLQLKYFMFFSPLNAVILINIFYFCWKMGLLRGLPCAVLEKSYQNRIYSYHIVSQFN